MISDLYPSWPTRHSNLRQWYYNDHIEISVHERRDSYYIYARVHSDELTRITNSSAEYRMRKLARYLAHRLLEHVGDDDALAEAANGTPAPDDLAGVSDHRVEAIDDFIDSLDT